MLATIFVPEQNLLLQDLSVGGLRVSEVDQLVEKFVDDDEVVPDALLLHVLEVVFEHLPEPEQSRLEKTVMAWGCYLAQR